MHWTVDRVPHRTLARRRSCKQRNANVTSALGTIFTTIGIALASSGGGDKKVAAAPAPVAKDTTINTGSKEEDELCVLSLARPWATALPGEARLGTDGQVPEGQDEDERAEPSELSRAWAVL